MDSPALERNSETKLAAKLDSYENEHDILEKLGAREPEIMAKGILQLLAYGNQSGSDIIIFPRASKNILSLAHIIEYTQLRLLMCDWVIIYPPYFFAFH